MEIAKLTVYILTLEKRKPYIWSIEILSDESIFLYILHQNVAWQKCHINQAKISIIHLLYGWYCVNQLIISVLQQRTSLISSRYQFDASPCWVLRRRASWKCLQRLPLTVSMSSVLSIDHWFIQSVSCCPLVGHLICGVCRRKKETVRETTGLTDSSFSNSLYCLDS